MAGSDDAGVLAAARRLVERAREMVPSYAASVAPVRTDQVSALMAAAECHVEVFPFQSDTVAMVLPKCEGVYPVLINRAAEQTDRFFALRHELGHVLNGDVDGAVFLADEGYMSGAERAADLFALADLVPGWWIAELRRGRTPWREVKRQIAMAVATYAEAWPAQRFGDRAELRLALYREHGI
jgi:Zn-dependent peptidase ImmA (M78 family)